jgi:hypothetical protein
MGITRIAAVATVVGGVIMSVAVGLWNLYAGLFLLGLLLTFAGVQSLRSTNG